MKLNDCTPQAQADKEFLQQWCTGKNGLGTIHQLFHEEKEHFDPYVATSVSMHMSYTNAAILGGPSGVEASAIDIIAAAAAAEFLPVAKITGLRCNATASEKKIAEQLCVAIQVYDWSVHAAPGKTSLATRVAHFQKLRLRDPDVLQRNGHWTYPWMAAVPFVINMEEDLKRVAMDMREPEDGGMFQAVRNLFIHCQQDSKQLP
jgi:hypothetical protein